MVMEIKFHGEDIRLLPSGALMIMSEHVLVLADLHLGKGVQLRDHGVPLIDQLDTKTILKLHADLKKYQPKTCIICGDLMHVQSRHLSQQLQWFNNELMPYDCRFVLTEGNHDQDMTHDLSKIEIVDFFDVNQIRCSHFPIEGRPNIAGHLHPGVRLQKGRVGKVYKAFAVDDVGIICPAYGHYTGAYAKLAGNKQFFACYGKDVRYVSAEL